ncbi:MAG: glycosyltransferase [Phototrophicaceae bacterium]
MRKPVVHFTGGDNFGWALDEDLRLVKQTLEDKVSFTDDIMQADIIHTAWWEPYANLSDQQLNGKRLICNIPAEPYRYLTLPAHRHIREKIGHWVARSTEGYQQSQILDYNVSLIPYIVDIDLFYPLESDNVAKQELIKKWSIPTDKYLVGNFHRDSEGHDLSTPKLVKGPDLFVEMMRSLKEKGYPIHVVLAGPRRHWVRRKLTEYDVPFTYIGTVTAEDDLHINILSRSELNLLYAVCDLYVVSSRSEGGPQSIMESAAAQCKIISTRVGLAEDILDERAIFDDIVEGIHLIEQDIEVDYLASTILSQYERVQANHTQKTAKPLWQKIYDSWQDIPIYHMPPAKQTQSHSIWQLYIKKIYRRLRPNLSIGIWHTFFKPPYGGGNQFLLALKKALLTQGLNIIENKLTFLVDAYLLNSIHFDVERFLEKHHNQHLNIVHRIDGPIFLIRGFDKEKDDLAFDINQQLADSTVLQSFWSYEQILSLGYRPVKPVIVHNAVDGDIFHTKGRVQFSKDRKIRLISSRWSDNPRKGGSLYKWLDQNLDWDRYDYTFVGRASETFDNIKMVDPVPSEELANILREHDIYITASQKDPCSNALIEALQCGLPTLYFNDGGHPELVKFGGLPFEGEDDVLIQLDRLAEHYDLFKALIVTQSLDDVAATYMKLLRESIY